MLTSRKLTLRNSQTRLMSRRCMWRTVIRGPAVFLPFAAATTRGRSAGALAFGFALDFGFFAAFAIGTRKPHRMVPRQVTARVSGSVGRDDAVRLERW